MILCVLLLCSTAALTESPGSAVTGAATSSSTNVANSHSTSLSDLHYSDCQPQTVPLQATYLLTANTSAGESLGADQTVHLWREGDDSQRVAHSFPGSLKVAPTTEMWNKINNGLLRVVKHFDSHQRAIEYEPIDIGSPTASGSWVNKFYLIPNALFDKVQAVAADNTSSANNQEGKAGDCLIEATLADAQTLTHFSVTWNTARQLPVFFQIKQRMATAGNSETLFQIIEWQLKDLSTDAAMVAEQYNRWDRFDTMDYADVGDNESDPFLMTMINLGFISHGASGFYDSRGSTLSGGGHRHNFSIIK
ncbi:MAG: hypothetical protein AB8B63_22865 [Granulosicoccus sp.]